MKTSRSKHARRNAGSVRHTNTAVAHFGRPNPLPDWWPASSRTPDAGKDGETSHAQHQARRWLGLAVLCSAFFMVILDVAIVNVALPSIQTDLDFSRHNLQWVVSAYALTFGGLLLLGGRAADLLGRRRVFIAGRRRCSPSPRCSRACSGRMAPLSRARALQGIGAAAMTPAALSILMTSFPRRCRAQQGARRLGGRRRIGRHGRPSHRRRPDRHGRLGVDLPAQRPDRAPSSSPSPDPARGESSAPGRRRDSTSPARRP